MKGKSLLSISDLTAVDIRLLISTAISSKSWGWIDSLKNKLENLGEEVQLTVRDMVGSGRKPERGFRKESFEEAKPSRYSEDYRRTIRPETPEPTREYREEIVEEIRSDILKAQVILDDLEKSV